MAHKPTFHAYSTTLDSFFYACSGAIVDSFVIVYFFLRNITFRSIIVERQAKGFAILGVIHRLPAAIPVHYVFCYSAVAHMSR